MVANDHLMIRKLNAIPKIPSWPPSSVGVAMILLLSSQIHMYDSDWHIFDPVAWHGSYAEYNVSAFRRYFH